MSGFAEFIKSFCVVAVSGGLAMLISPEGNVKKYVKFIISLCVVCALLSPILSFSGKLPQYLENIEFEVQKEAEDVSVEVYSDVALVAKENIEAEVENLLASNFDYEKEDIYVVATLDCTNLSAIKITDITVFLADIGKKDDVSDYLSELFLQTANIHIMKKGE